MNRREQLITEVIESEKLKLEGLWQKIGELERAEEIITGTIKELHKEVQRALDTIDNYTVELEGEDNE